MNEVQELFAAGELRRMNPLEMTLRDPVKFTKRLKLTATFRGYTVDDAPDIDLDKWIGPITDQDGIGMCCASTTAEIIQAGRAMSGFPFVAISGGDIYNRVSGGRDQGSVPEDCLEVAQREGASSLALCEYLNWRGSSAAAKADRINYRLDESYFIDNAADIPGGLSQGFLFNLCMAWYDSDSNPDSKGRLPENPRGSAGGHSITGCGWVTIDGKKYVKFRNHWTARYGVNGCGFLPYSRLANNLSDFRMWFARSVTVAPGDVKVPAL